MNQRHYLLKGTFVLTATGLLTRTAGFFYKIFLSRTIGASEIGRFQLTLPVVAFCMALSCGGIQTAVSRFTAEYCAEKDRRSALRLLACALFLSGSLSLGCCAALFFGSNWLASSFLLEPSCAALLEIIAFSLPFSAIHGCLNGFFIGQKNVSVSAASQLLEQLLRIVSVLLFYFLFQQSGRVMDASVMALGQIAGELCAALYCMYRLFFSKKLSAADDAVTGLSDKIRHSISADSRAKRNQEVLLPILRHDMKKTLSVSAPLGLNRMLTCILQGIEAALLPQMLGSFGHDTSQALAIYGTLTGMTLPLILFPTAVTGSISTLLLPVVSEAKTLGQDKKIAGTVGASFRGSLLLGLFFLTAFLLFGDDMGNLLFHSTLAGSYTKKLALLCPFLYINTTLASILHGIGKTTAASMWNIASFGIRLYFILHLVPNVGVDGYFAGLLISQAFITVCSLIVLYRHTHFDADLTETFTKPALLCIVCGSATVLLYRNCPFFATQSWGILLLRVVLFSSVFLLLGFVLLLSTEERRTLLSRFHRN